MLSFTNKVAFLLFALVTLIVGLHGFYRVYRQIARGRSDTDLRLNHLSRRIRYAIATTLLQNRTFRKRPFVSALHSLIFYGFVFYLLVNLVDLLEGFVPFSIPSASAPAAAYNLLADALSAQVLFGVVALVLRRFLLPSRRDFSFNDRTLLHRQVRKRYVTNDSIIVSAFIFVHVGSRAIGAAAKLASEGPDNLQPFAMLLSHLFTPANAHIWSVIGYWGALGSVLAFWMYFPRSKHVHIFMAPAKYLFSRDASSGVLPALPLDLEVEEPKLGAKHLEDLAWPRLLDAYACIQCNRCQDVCPATATGKALSPSALEINKRMELNDLARSLPAFESGAASPQPLLAFAISPEAAWACTTCGACLQVCPVQDEPMLDIVDVRRHQVMIDGEFPAQLQSAFRGMERAQNPWGINHDKRMDWAGGLKLKTTDENPQADVLFWVGCAASYDPQAQKTARAFVQLLDHAGVNFAVLGKRECCTGDSARRAGNEYLYRQLADTNVATLNALNPKLIVAACPHCMNSLGNEYKQVGGDYKVMHHTEYLKALVDDGRLKPALGSSTITYHDPCYLGRHNGVYDAPRNLLHVISNTVLELDRSRENSFCCGAGGAQFWKEEEPGTERISDNRYSEAQRALDGASNKVLAVGCPFCKSMLQSTPAGADDGIAIKDIAELLWEALQPAPSAAIPIFEAPAPPSAAERQQGSTPEPSPVSSASVARELKEPSAAAPVVERKKWIPKKESVSSAERTAPVVSSEPLTPKQGEPTAAAESLKTQDAIPLTADLAKESDQPRKRWTPKRNTKAEHPSGEG